MVKGDKGKFAKRGGRGSASSRFHATSEEEIEQRNNRIAEFDALRSKRRSDDDDDDDDEDKEKGVGENENEEQQEDKGIEGRTTVPTTKATKVVEAHMKEMKVMDNDEGEGGYEDDTMNIGGAEPIRTMSRKERELAEKEKAKADYLRRHELGLTDEYKRDMAKLEEVRKRREAAAQRALEEREIKGTAELEARERAQKMGILEEEDDDSEDEVDDNKKKPDDKKNKVSSSNKKSTPIIPKLDKIAIKKMKPTQLKEALKARNLDIQGNAKELTDRLLEYEAAR